MSGIRRTGRSRRNQIIPSAITPLQISASSLRLWLDASTISALGSGKIDTWNDSSGAGYIASMTQGTDANRPSLVTNGIGGKPDVLGGNTTSLFTAVATAIGTTALTLAVNVTWTTATADRMMCGARWNAHHYMLATDVTNAGQAIFRINVATTGVVVIKSDSTTLNDGVQRRIIGTWSQSDNTMRLWVNGVLQAQTASAVGNIIAPSVNGDKNAVMSATDGVSFGNGWIGDLTDFVAYNTALSAADVALLDAYLASR